MSFRRFRRKVRCMLKHGPRGCPHIERHSRRPKRPSVAQAPRTPKMPAPPLAAPPVGRHARG